MWLGTDQFPRNLIFTIAAPSGGRTLSPERPLDTAPLDTVMPTLIARRLLSALPTLFIIVTLAFFLIRLAPGGPFDLEQPLEARVMDNLRRIYQLDRPLHEQYGLYLASLLRGDLGPSFYFRDFSVAELLAKGLPVSVRLGASALALALALGGAIGVLAALRQNSWIDYLVTGLATIGLTVPTFVVGPVLQIVFGIWFAWLPLAGWGDGAIRNSILPVLVLALPQIAIIARLIRAAMIETLRANHIRTLRAQGLGQRIVIQHALRSAVLPVVSYLGPAAAQLLTGSIIVETIFGLPGVGRYFVEGALNRNYTLVMGTVVLIAVFVLVFNLMADIVYALLDPRLRAGAAG
jgi:oligopeptide transport system permease protein